MVTLLLISQSWNSHNHGLITDSRECRERTETLYKYQFRGIHFLWKKIHSSSSWWSKIYSTPWCQGSRLHEVSMIKNTMNGLSCWLSGKKSTCQCRGNGFDPCFREIARAEEWLSPLATTTKPVLYSPWFAITEAPGPKAQSPQQEKPLQWEAHTPQLESSPDSPQLEESPCSKEDPVELKIK